VQALKGKLADRLELGHALDRGVHLAVDQDLAALGLVAQTRGKVRDRASHRILKAPLEADAAERRILSRLEVLLQRSRLNRSPRPSQLSLRWGPTQSQWDW
jgi:hypothetical protein